MEKRTTTVNGVDDIELSLDKIIDYNALGGVDETDDQYETNFSAKVLVSINGFTATGEVQFDWNRGHFSIMLENNVFFYNLENILSFCIKDEKERNEALHKVVSLILDFGEEAIYEYRRPKSDCVIIRQYYS